MPQLPSASVSVSAAASTPGAGTDVICIFAPCATQADITPRIFGNANAIHELHGYSEGLEYASFHMRETRKPVIFVALPIDSPGVIGREDSSGNTGSSAVTVSEGADGCLSEHDGILEVEHGGTVGTDQIVLKLSLDGGLSFKSVRLGTGNAYTIPDVDVDVALGAGTLVAGDTVLTWHGSGPRASMSDVTTAREALAAEMMFFRSIMLIGDLQSDTEAAAFRDELAAYDTENQRFVYGRASVYDRLPLAALSVSTHRMTAGTSLTFAEVGASGDTITRATGSWISDGFAIGDTVTITGASDGTNNKTAVIANLTATVMTLGTEDLAAEVSANCTVVGRATLTFANAGETITRNRGSWLADGFRAGDSVTITGTDSATNDGTFVVSTVTALVMTLAAGGVDADEVSPVTQVSIEAGQTEAEWMAAVTDEFEAIDGTRYIDLAAGRAWKASPFTGWNFLRPASWAASLREYQHDLHVATWKKQDGPTGWNLTDADGNRAQWDDRVNGGAGTAARFTTFRTWGNGPAGAFIARSLTRASDGDILVNTNKVAVLNLALTTVQFATENIIGRDLVLNSDGTAITTDRNTMKMEVDSALALALLKDTRGEGPRASLATWTPSADDVLNVADPAITGVLDLNFNGTVVSVTTTVRVRSGGN
jgi:hypothetical protein